MYEHARALTTRSTQNDTAVNELELLRLHAPKVYVCID